MKSYLSIKILFTSFLLGFIVLEPINAYAQRMNHPSTGRTSTAAASRGGGPATMNRAATTPQRPATAPNRTATQPSRGGNMQQGRNPGGQMPARPSGPNVGSSRPNTGTARPNTSNRGTVTGGAQQSQNRRPSAQPGTNDRSINQNRQQRDRATSDRNTADRTNSVNRGDRGTSGSRNQAVTNRGDRNNTGNRETIDRGRNPNNGRPARPGGNNINIGNNNQININAQRNTFVRVNVMHPMMMRPPFMWGGFRIYSMHSFFWFPFRPMFWGPMWHPWGFHTPMLPPQAQVVNVVNETNIINETNITNVTNVTNIINEYHYVDGVFYQKDDEGYVVVPAPIGAEVRSIPDNFEKVNVGDNEFNLYWGGAYFEETANGFRVVPPTAGTLVENLSDGGEEVKIGDKTFIRFGDTYYLPVQVNGRNMYEVVYIESEED